MIEYSENDRNTYSDAAYRGVTGLHNLKEYWEDWQPEYDWDTNDNLIAFLKFNHQEWIIERVFQQFLIDWQPFARNTEVLWNEPAEGVGSNNDEYEPSKLVFKKVIWKHGVVIDTEQEDDKGIKVMAASEIIFMIAEKQLRVRTEGKGKAHRRLLYEVVRSFSSNTKPEIRLACCNCSICEKRGIVESYRIEYMHLENLRNRFIPKVQCYQSGQMIRLDEISTLEQPEVNISIIHHIDDEAFADSLRKILKRRALSIKVWDARDILAGKDLEQEYKINIESSHVVVLMVSLDLCTDDFLFKQIDLIAKLHKTQKVLAKVVEVRPYNWKELTPFNTTPILALNDTPISSVLDHDEAWRKIGDKLYKDIEGWLEKVADRNNT